MEILKRFLSRFTPWYDKEIEEEKDKSATIRVAESKSALREASAVASYRRSSITLIAERHEGR